MKKIKTVIIAGATGFIGTNLTKRLLLNGIKVYAIGTKQDKLNKLKEYGNVVLIQAKFEDYDTIVNYIDENDSIDTFINLAWEGISSGFYDDYNLQLENSKYACLTMDIAKKLNVKKYIFFSTFGYYKVIEKNKQILNTNIYGIVKKSTEDILKSLAIKHDIEYNAVVLSNIYGCGDSSNVSFLIKELINNKPLNLIKGDKFYDFTYIDDVVDGIISICNKGVNLKSYYLGQRDLKTFKELLIDMRDTLNPSVDLNFGVFPDDSYIDYQNININDLFVDTGFECKCDFKESILKTAEWLKNNQ